MAATPDLSPSLPSHSQHALGNQFTGAMAEPMPTPKESVQCRIDDGLVNPSGPVESQSASDAARELGNLPTWMPFSFASASGQRPHQATSGIGENDGWNDNPAMIALSGDRLAPAIRPSRVAL